MDKELEKVSPEVRNYIEEEILPRYDNLFGHTKDHIKYVISRSLKFAEEVEGVNYDMVYIIAAFHDLGRLVDNETHNIESGKMLMSDKFIEKNFSREERIIMKEAVEDHRASLKYEPRSVYGRIVSSADRSTSVKRAVTRAIKYNKLLNPGETEEEAIKNSLEPLKRKFGKDGYARKKMFFKDSDYERFLEDMEQITETPEGFFEFARGLV